MWRPDSLLIAGPSPSSWKELQLHSLLRPWTLLQCIYCPLKPGPTWIFLAACLFIEQFTAVAGNDSDNTIGVRQRFGSCDEFNGIGSGRVGWGGAEAVGQQWRSG
ncbi:hypothetical protein R3P38DRAFT_2780836 [Favolaschia claudopus]|uniref:Uncharacterized protein n=1 Tax=Favolaschia claudopus TaxID=2862362 RepID=A0AAW0B6B8_9AGAR